jgi:hypothetical protein
MTAEFVGWRRVHPIKQMALPRGVSRAIAPGTPKGSTVQYSPAMSQALSFKGGFQERVNGRSGPITKDGVCRGIPPACICLGQ